MDSSSLIILLQALKIKQNDKEEPKIPLSLYLSFLIPPKDFFTLKQIYQIA